MWTISTLFKNAKAHWVPVFVLCFATWGIYGASIGHHFLSNWDDNKYITANPVITGISAHNLKEIFTSFYVGNYAPVQMLSYMLDYQFWGLNAAGFICTNIVLHVLNGLLLYWILHNILKQRLASFLAAALFLLHPVQVESVDWISQRKNLLSMLFMLLAWIAYIRYRRQRGVKLYLLSVMAFSLALLAKSIAVVAPVVFLAYDFCCEKAQLHRKWLTGMVPYLVASVVVAGLALISQRPELGGGRTSYHGGSPLATFYTMLPVFVSYLRMLFWPDHLSAVYEPPIKNTVDLDVAGSAVLLAIIAAISCSFYRKDRVLLFGMVVLFLALLPVSQIFPLVTLMNDRYLYFPMVGASFIFGRIAVLASESPSGLWRFSFLGILCTGVLLLAVCSFQRTKVWQDAETLWADAVKKTPQSKVAWFGLGNAQDNNGNLTAAELQYRRALAIDPSYAEALDNLSYLYLRREEFAKARDVLQMTVLKYPDKIDALLNLGTSHYLLRNFIAAEAAYSKALALNPASAEVLITLAHVNLRLGRMEQAAAFHRKANSGKERTKDLLYGMAAYAALSGNKQEALDYIAKAVASGYDDCIYMSNDPDMESLRPLPAMQRITATVCRDSK